MKAEIAIYFSEKMTAWIKSRPQIPEKTRMKELEERKEMCLFQKRITTCLFTKIEYEIEIDTIDRMLQNYNYKLTHN